MGRLPFIIATSLVVITAKIISPMIVEFFTLLAGLPQSLEEQRSVEPVEIIVEPYVETWKCPGCTPNEQYVLEKLQENTKISDPNALATIMGNIKQESKFISNICEGGSRVSYFDCHRGGYGLIQWTSIGRHRGLGLFAKKYDCDPSALDCQTRYMINEPIFQRYLPEFEGHGFSISQYMTPAYYWLGWGIKGNREIYSHEYKAKLILS
tara:strand:- start:40 stop:666 length:627 start_codon:yes stop_codon:yes gene_type:complete